MERNTLIIGVLVLVLGIGIGYLLWGVAAPTSPDTNRVSQDGMMTGQDIDRHFIEQMIPHHDGAIEMARLALERAQTEEVRTLARDIIAAQESENAQMRLWHRAWFGSEAAPAHHLAHMGGMSGDMATLRAISEEQFDREFVRQMIPHHEMAIMMAQMLRGGTERPEMRALADEIISAQSAEIDLMRSWLILWENSGV